MAAVGRRRYLIGVMLMLVITIAYVDRVNMSMAGPVIADQFHLSKFALGLVYSAFFWGYAATMLPGGLLIDRHGKRIVLPMAVMLWTVISMLTGFVNSVGSLLATRILLGIGEAPAYPSCNLLVREWSPLRERGIFTSLMQTGSLLGPGLATAPAAWLVNVYGWRAPFWTLSSLGLLWLAAWLLLYRRPEDARWLGESERQYILAARKLPEKDTASADEQILMSIQLLLRQRPMIGILLANGPQTYTLYMLLTWLPSYLNSAERGFDLIGSGALTSAMFLLATVGAILLGHSSDRWLALSPEQAHRGERRKLIAAAMFIALSSLAFVPWIGNKYLLVFAIAVTLMMVTVAITLIYALTNDLIVDEHSAGRTFALVSFAGQVMGLLAPIVTGWIVQYFKFRPVFIVTAVLLLLGGVSAWTLPTRQLQPVVRR
jgi:MFS family permease